jgi:hypothetical protein
MPDQDWGDLAALPVGRRDALLLELQRRNFGSVMQASTSCSTCGESVEFEVPIEQLLEHAAKEVSPEVEFTKAGWDIEMFYNSKRRHGFNNLLSPVEYERRFTERLVSV